jgi:pyruvate kinase
MRPDKQCAVMLDTKGPEIRTGFLKDHQPIELEMGQDLEITTDYTFEGTSAKIACSYGALATTVKTGSVIYIADGSLTCEVKEIKKDSIIVNVMNSCKLGEKKNMNLPGAVVDLPTLTE